MLALIVQQPRLADVVQINDLAKILLSPASFLETAP
jgi:hypothetical protein